MASIILVSGESRGDYYLLGHRTNVIGRAEAVPIQILDVQVSRKHLQVRFDQTTRTYRAVDMKSRHGVFINGHKITTETVLQDRDMIRVGQTSLLFAERDLDESGSAWHRFKKAGEAKRPTRVELQIENPSPLSESRHIGATRRRPTMAGADQAVLTENVDSQQVLIQSELCRFS